MLASPSSTFDSLVLLRQEQARHKPPDRRRRDAHSSDSNSELSLPRHDASGSTGQSARRTRLYRSGRSSIASADRGHTPAYAARCGSFAVDARQYSRSSERASPPRCCARSLPARMRACGVRNALSLNLATKCGAGLERGPAERSRRPGCLGGRGDYLASPAPPLNDADTVALLQPRDGIEPKGAE
jgi:hypothetical protein